MPRIRCAAAVMIVLAAGATNADEPVTTRTIVATLLSAADCKDAPDEIHVVLNGNERYAVPLKRTKPQCRWTGTSDFRIDATDTMASLRLGNARTDCSGSTAEPDEKNDAYVAHLQFKSILRDVQRVRINTVPPTIKVSYVRELPPCRESATYDGSAEIQDVVFTRESLSIQLGWPKPDHGRPELFVNHPAVAKHAARIGDTLRLTLDEFVDAIAEQRHESPKPTTALRLPENASDIERKRLAQTNFVHLDLRVK